MASINYYKSNVLRVLSKWEPILNTTILPDDKLSIEGYGYCRCKLTNDYCNGRKASKYRKVVVDIQLGTNIPDTLRKYNYENLVEITIEGTYTDSDGNKNNTITSINCTILKSKHDGNGRIKFTRVVEMEDYDYNECYVYVRNHTSLSVLLYSCKMYRSQDISSSQVGESIGWGVTLNQVIAYQDGCELYYDGMAKPDKLWWMEDTEGNFSGINVNNERMIKFSRKNEILLD